MHKQKGKIVNVEIPYATKLVIQELGAITNVHLRLITSGDTGKLRPFEPPTEGTVRVKELKPLELEDVVVSTVIPKEEEPAYTLQEMVDFGSQQAQRQVNALLLDANTLAPIADEEEETIELSMAPSVITVQPGQPFVVQQGQPLVAAQQQPLVATQQQPLVAAQAGGFMMSAQDIAAARAVLSGGGAPRGARRANQIVMPSPTILEPMIGGAEIRMIGAPMPGLAPTIAINQPKNPVFAIDTSPQAMMQDGLQPMAYQTGGQTVTLRRSHSGGGGGFPSMPSSSGGGGPITVRKLGSDE
jgi:hypothetical protein